ncbi:glutamate--tRNA ligase [Clostridium chauvoei]|uniref:Glutamate--tRNA ligase n=2 Tax=Clostridium chauvoei TaxID=46867 RepID=S6FB28_9CLOT|nr:glutamate--tRNA ligase [Clostridium chauvoei]ATD55551.1 glutamate--tRNA ligase [Clostridium chauvoei]ATD56772.1 glutamate--tRNA ligase [Clostridium chauvoei]MBX7281240.1 glutamate--tRNA ligase [Clostridium chauvoei]MBX7283722.1 glutamate--tRNA ligase [Clostridium chauvoei]MBX7286329.1 glutamate--tRNA ligase [Clostridium chauvoei]
MSLEKLAEIIFPGIDKTPEYYIEKYPKRELKEGAVVCRYAPSPTGFQHIGGVFAALINERLASQTEGVFYLRIEDTDQKREVAGAIEDTIATMHNFGMDFNEGMTGTDTLKGNYGPYRQSQRAEIYKTFAKDLVKKGLAYPCFCTPEELAELREKQTAEKITPGYYGEYAKYRNLTSEEAIEKIEKGESYIIRLKSPGNIENRVEFHDLIKGDVHFPENNQDIVLIKGDGLPTYHFAHAIDDALMRTTHVIRGEEWLSSLPIHVQLFDVLGLERPEYAHIPTIMKNDNGSKRKLSKRKDAEAAVSYYKEVGYPMVSVIEYLLNIINSTFEEWRVENPLVDYHDFEIALDKMSKSGALFDIVKLNDVSKEVICKMKPEVVYNYYTTWAKEFDKEMFELVTANETMTKEIFNIDKEGPKPRKDFAKWEDVKEKIFYFYDELFAKETADQVELPKTLSLENAKAIIEAYAKEFTFNIGSQEAWFDELKEIGLKLGYCANRKEYKANPDQYKGMISDVAGAVRAALSHRTNTPDLYTIMQIMGEEKVKDRFNKFLNI